MNAVLALKSLLRKLIYNQGSTKDQFVIALAIAIAIALAIAIYNALKSLLRKLIYNQAQPRISLWLHLP